MRIQGVLQNIRGNRYQRPIECGFSQSKGANYRKERRGVKKREAFRRRFQMGIIGIKLLRYIFSACGKVRQLASSFTGFKRREAKL